MFVWGPFRVHTTRPDVIQNTEKVAMVLLPHGKYNGEKICIIPSRNGMSTVYCDPISVCKNPEDHVHRGDKNQMYT